MRRLAIGRMAAVVLLLAIVAVASFAFYESYFTNGQPSCPFITPGIGYKTQTTKTVFGAVTEFQLPGPDRFPNAVTTAPDGSVWFAEQNVPGVAHLFPGNGTLVEYAWPGYKATKPPNCHPFVSSVGIAIWNGRVWAIDEFGNVIVGVNPADGSVRSVNSSTAAKDPNWLAVGPDGSLWFTSSGTPPKLGRIQTDMTLSVTSLMNLGSDQPVQLVFVNSTLAYLATLNASTNSTTHACVCNGHIYSFNPSSVGPSLTPHRVGGQYSLILPTSVAYAMGKTWVAQHGSSSVVGYDFVSAAWTVFPTSTVPWSGTTLPLQVQGGNGLVWFNEHYANKIALLDINASTLTEFSESNPPASGADGIQNDLSISAASKGLWFTSLSGNYVGFVSKTQDVGFHIAATGANRASMAPGGSASFDLSVSGTWPGKMTVNASDSENPGSVPTLIKITPSTVQIPQGEKSPVDLVVKVEAGPTIRPGNYTVAVTLTSGTVQQTAYLFIEIT